MCVGKGAVVTRVAAGADVPGRLARLAQLVPEIERDALAGVVPKLGKHRRVCPHGRAESRLVHGSAALGSGRATAAHLGPGGTGEQADNPASTEPPAP